MIHHTSYIIIIAYIVWGSLPCAYWRHSTLRCVKGSAPAGWALPRFARRVERNRAKPGETGCVRGSMFIKLDSWRIFPILVPRNWPVLRVLCSKYPPETLPVKDCTPPCFCVGGWIGLVVAVTNFFGSRLLATSQLSHTRNRQPKKRRKKVTNWTDWL